MKSLSAALILVSLLSGCATYNRSNPMPQNTDSVRIQIEDKMPSKWSLPVGVFIDDGSRLVVSGHQSNAGIGIMFGVAGVLIQDAMERSSGKKLAHEAISDLEIDWSNLSEEILGSLLAQYPGARASLDSGTLRMDIKPYAILDVHQRPDAQLFLVMEISLSNQKGESLWSPRYFLRTPSTFNIEQPEIAFSSEVYETELRDGLGILYKTLLIQLGNGFAEGEELSYDFTPAYAGKNLPLKGRKVAEFDDYIVLRMKIADAIVFSGYHIVPKTDLAPEAPATAPIL